MSKQTDELQKSVEKMMAYRKAIKKLEKKKPVKSEEGGKGQKGAKTG